MAAKTACSHLVNPSIRMLPRVARQAAVVAAAARIVRLVLALHSTDTQGTDSTQRMGHGGVTTPLRKTSAASNAAAAPAVAGPPKSGKLALATAATIVRK